MTHGERIDRAGTLLTELKARARKGQPLLSNGEMAIKLGWHGPLGSSYVAAYLQRLEGSRRIEVERIGVSHSMKRRVYVGELQLWTPWPPGTDAPPPAAKKQPLAARPKKPLTQAIPGGAKRAALREARAQGIEAVFAALVQLAVTRGRCPENTQVEKVSGFQFGHKIKDLAKAGRIRVEVYDKNFRVVEICEGPHKGARTMGAPTKRRPYLIFADGERRQVQQPAPRPARVQRQPVPALAPRPVLPTADLEEPLPTGGIELVQFTERTCRYPLGTFLQPARRFCGADHEPGVPYCREHAAIAFDQPKTRNHHRSAAAI